MHPSPCQFGFTNKPFRQSLQKDTRHDRYFDTAANSRGPLFARPRAAPSIDASEVSLPVAPQVPSGPPSRQRPFSQGYRREPHSWRTTTSLNEQALVTGPARCRQSALLFQKCAALRLHVHFAGHGNGCPEAMWWSAGPAPGGVFREFSHSPADVPAVSKAAFPQSILDCNVSKRETWLPWTRRIGLAHLGLRVYVERVKLSLSKICSLWLSVAI